MNWYEPILERDLLPDWLLRRAIRHLCAVRLQEETAGGPSAVQARFAALVADLKQSPVALHTADANRQHDEVPAAFFKMVLGPHLKYSSCYFPEGVETLGDAERAMLDLTAARAQLADGQNVLELGCGWGSLSLYMAEHFPNSSITGVSNSASQREYILEQAKLRGLGNLNIITADMNAFSPGVTGHFDRVVSVEMFEHMRNYQVLMQRVSTWLKPDGLLFIHVFAHQTVAYPFEAKGSGDWMAEHFFTGGIMPSAGLLPVFQRDMWLVKQWNVSGTHYQRTSEEWLLLTDQHREEILQLFAGVYGEAEALRWLVRWRVFFMACAELFGYSDGEEWLVCHYLFEKARASS